MKTVEIGLSALILAGVIMLLFWQGAVWLKKNLKNESEYEKLYKTINSEISEAPVTEWWYDFLTGELTKLGQMKWKNQEKTHVISCTFWRKFSKIRLRRMIDDKEAVKDFNIDWVNN